MTVDRDVARHEREIEKLWDRKASKDDFAALKERVDLYGESVKANTRAVIALLSGIAICALGIAVTVLLAGGPT